jgi:Zn-dependent protease/predicted transcriptional regulator
MNWSLSLGRLAGIRIFVHWTFSLLIAWILLIHVMQGYSLRAALSGVIFVLTIFLCVTLHELGHALAARRYGIQTRDITLLPIGGVARLERMPREPKQELVVALAGPAVNVIIAGVLLVMLQILPPMQAGLLPLEGMNFLQGLLLVNVILVIFNLLPAFPMDGGRVLRALLAIRMSYVKATRIAATVGQGMAILFAFLAIFGPFSPFLLFIALFVFLGAQAEAQSVAQTATLKGLTVRDAMLTRFRSLREDSTLAEAVDQLLSGSQHDFPVERSGEVVGILSRTALVRGLSQHGVGASVRQAMNPKCRTVQAWEDLESVLQRLRENECPAMPVMEAERMVGLLTMENIAEMVMINKALAERDEPADVARLRADTLGGF